jgi:hypothetical protein
LNLGGAYWLLSQGKIPAGGVDDDVEVDEVGVEADAPGNVGNDIVKRGDGMLDSSDDDDEDDDCGSERISEIASGVDN